MYIGVYILKNTPNGGENEKKTHKPEPWLSFFFHFSISEFFFLNFFIKYWKNIGAFAVFGPYSGTKFLNLGVRLPTAFLMMERNFLQTVCFIPPVPRVHNLKIMLF